MLPISCKKAKFVPYPLRNSTANLSKEISLVAQKRLRIRSGQPGNNLPFSSIKHVCCFSYYCVCSLYFIEREKKSVQEWEKWNSRNTKSFSWSLIEKKVWANSRHFVIHLDTMPFIDNISQLSQLIDNINFRGFLGVPQVLQCKWQYKGMIHGQ